MTHQVDAPIVARRGNLLDNITNDGKKLIEFISCSPQILCGEQVEGDAVDAVDLAAPFQHLYDFESTRAVPAGYISKSSFSRPATIAVAHHRDVGGFRQRRNRAEQTLLIQGVQYRPCRISKGLP